MQQHPFIFSNEWKYRTRRHLAFWAFWWIFQGFLYASVLGPQFRELPYFERLGFSMIQSFFYVLTCHVFLSYTLMYYVLPGYLLKNRYFATAALVAVLFIMTGFSSYITGNYILVYVEQWLLNKKEVRDPRYPSLGLALLAGLRGGITIGGVAAAIKLMKYWYVKEQRNMQLQRENIAAQLQLLKAQVHPHFLFNTLNNIYSFTQKNNPEASKLTMGLSDMLRYMLYECNRPTVPLSKELYMLEEYIELEKIRYGNKLELHVETPADAKDHYIAPLLLLPFVENCFKHGTSNVLESPWVTLDITLKKNLMTMKLVNGKSSHSQQLVGGIGIDNVRKRLELLYPGKHELVINNEEDVFIVTLKIELERKKFDLSTVLQTQPALTNAY
jgi:sensor histidine kinase YesM